MIDATLPVWAYVQVTDLDSDEPSGLIGIEVDGHTLGNIDPDKARRLAVQLLDLADEADGTADSDQVLVATARARDGILLTSTQITEMTLEPVTGERLDRLAAAIPHSSVPQAIQTIVGSLDD